MRVNFATPWKHCLLREWFERFVFFFFQDKRLMFLDIVSPLRLRQYCLRLVRSHGMGINFRNYFISWINLFLGSQIVSYWEQVEYERTKRTFREATVIVFLVSLISSSPIRKHYILYNINPFPKWRRNPIAQCQNDPWGNGHPIFGTDSTKAIQLLLVQLWLKYYVPIHSRRPQY